MNWKTKVTELLGSKYPIIQEAFGGFGTSALAAPVPRRGASAASVPQNSFLRTIFGLTHIFVTSKVWTRCYHEKSSI